MKKYQHKTYGRSVLPNQLTNSDYDSVFGKVKVNVSPFGTSESDTSVGIGNNSHARVEPKDSPERSNSVKNKSKLSLESPHDNWMGFMKATNYRADKTQKPQRKQTSKKKDIEPSETTCESKKKPISKRGNKKACAKENEATLMNIPDYNAIAEDSFVIETETVNKTPLTKCSTPLANIVNSPSFIQPCDKMPTPIFQTNKETIPPDESVYIDSSMSMLSPACTLDKRSIHLNSNHVTVRRSSRIKSRLSWSRKIVFDKHIEDMINTTSYLGESNCQNYSDDVQTSWHKSSSCSHSYESSFMESSEDLLKSITQNISDFEAIHFNLDSSDEVKMINTSSVDTNKSYHDSSKDLFLSNGQDDDKYSLPKIEEEESSLDDPSIQSKSILQNSLSTFVYCLSNASISYHEPETPKDKLLDICEQDDYISFSSCIPSRMMNQCVKIGEGVYGEVFRSMSREQNVAIKIIPMEGNFDVNDCPQKTFEEILPEAVIAKELSDLCVGSANLNFCQVNRISCVKGTFPTMLLKQWDAYAQRKTSENDRPDFFPTEQLFVVFEFVDGGTALENFEMLNYRQSLSVLRQTVFALAVAESTLEFEHRDLHIGNILVRPYQEQNIKFRLHDENFEFASEGVFATIIDFTISRLKKDGCAVFCDISTDDGLFEGTGDFQFDVYRDMRKTNGNGWSEFCPYTNILWTQYLCKKLLTAIKVKENGREHRNSLRHLRQLNDKISKYESCFHLAMEHDLWDF